MTIFKLPDLGEGLPDAEIHEWYVKEGDRVETDQPLVSMETAKAVVDVPAPQAGIISKLYGQAGDIIKTGDPLLAFESTATKAPDKGTVVGNLEESTESSEDNFRVGSAERSDNLRVTASARTLAKQWDIALEHIQGSGEHGVIQRSDVEKLISKENKTLEGYEPLRGVRRSMLKVMVESHKEVVPVSIFDEADINSWDDKQDITVRLIRAIVAACKKEPALNGFFDGKSQSRKLIKEVHLGLAMDSADGLFVPVIRDAAQKSDAALREEINLYKQQVSDRSINPEHLKDASISLSNFGKFAGKFANPIIVPPMIAILAVGRLYEAAVSHQSKIESHRILPLSLSFDHRAVTGGEATRFLGAVIDSLQQDR